MAFPESIDQVIDRLDGIITDARREKSRLGYFPALYRNVTVRVKDGIEAGRFEDGERMARLDVAFANRYFAAYDCIASGGTPSACWMASFEAALDDKPLVLHHLILGMNAHINLDLGVAAAQTCPGSELADFEKDFGEINLLLAEMIDDVQERLSSVSPFFWLLDRTGSYDEMISRTGLRATRGGAWTVANRLAYAHPDDRDAVIRDVDRAATAVAHAILAPGPIRRSIIRIVGMGERRRKVPEIIEALGA